MAVAVVAAAAAASDAAAAVVVAVVAVGAGAGENAAAAETRPVQTGQGRAQIHSPLVPCDPHILHARGVHCKTHDEAAKVPDLFHDSGPIHALSEGAPRVPMPNHVLSHRVRNHIRNP